MRSEVNLAPHFCEHRRSRPISSRDCLRTEKQMRDQRV